MHTFHIKSIYSCYNFFTIIVHSIITDAVVIRLEQNYRSTQTILKAANAVISNNTGRKEKSLWTAGEKGDNVLWYKAVDENDEANFIVKTVKEDYKKYGCYRRNAVLYRMNAQSNIVERALVSAGIPYRVYGGMRFYDRKEIKDVTSYLAFINNIWRYSQVTAYIVNNRNCGFPYTSFRFIYNPSETYHIKWIVYKRKI